MTYKIKYDLKADYGDFTKEEIKIEGKGGTDALLLTSIIRGNPDGEPHVGSKSIAFIDIDGRGKDFNIPDTELFQVMTHLALTIMENGVAPTWQLNICTGVFKIVQQQLMEMGDLDLKPND